MAENNKNKLADAANSPLEDLTFENIIAGPLIACVDAQHEASMVAYDYLMSLGFRKDSKNLADYEPVPLTFYFVREGITSKLTLPLLSVVPVPYLLIGHVDLHYQATVTACDNNKTTVRYNSPTSRRIKDQRNTEQKNTLTAREAIDINLRATTTDMPAGLAKLMDILTTQMTEVNDVKSDGSTETK